MQLQTKRNCNFTAYMKTSTSINEQRLAVELDQMHNNHFVRKTF